MSDQPAYQALDATLASRFASLALAHAQREYPNKLDHVLNGAQDLRSPSELHPIFYGSFDWHSNVHGYWLLATLYRAVPELPERGRIRDLFDGQITDAKVAREVEYLREPGRGAFERPYGWAWLLMFAAELARLDTDEGRRWRLTLQPLADAFVERFNGFLPKATYPIRVGTHFNTAFALALGLEYAVATRNASFGDLLRHTARAWYANDADCQAWEPGGDDFLSSALIEAECMRRTMPAADFATWFDRFLPRLARGEPATLFRPASVSDRSDGKIAHLDGLNLSRAWCWRGLARTLEATDPRRQLALDAAQRHLDVSLPHVAGDYAGEHWLATYALLAVTA
ncbi:MAG TPA: DUF2891 domain-containing protein [Gemmatimonadaceae bacterium]